MLLFRMLGYDVCTIKEGIWLDEQNEYFQQHFGNFARTAQSLLLINNFLTFLQINNSMVSNNCY